MKHASKTWNLHVILPPKLLWMDSQFSPPTSCLIITVILFPQQGCNAHGYWERGMLDLIYLPSTGRLEGAGRFHKETSQEVGSHVKLREHV